MRRYLIYCNFIKIKRLNTFLFNTLLPCTEMPLTFVCLFMIKLEDRNLCCRSLYVPEQFTFFVFIFFDSSQLPDSVASYLRLCACVNGSRRNSDGCLVTSHYPASCLSELAFQLSVYVTTACLTPFESTNLICVDFAEIEFRFLNF
jgi:hypothetical protein